MDGDSSWTGSGWVGGVAAAVAIPLITYLVNRRPTGAAPLTRMKAGPGIIGILILGAILFLSPWPLMLLGVIPKDQIEPVFVGLCLLLSAFGAGNIYGVVDCWTRSVDWTSEPIKFSRWNKTWEARWSEIDLIEFRKLGQYWRLEFANGEAYAFSEMMAGSRDFLEAAEKREIRIDRTQYAR